MKPQEIEGSSNHLKCWSHQVLAICWENQQLVSKLWFHISLLEQRFPCLCWCWEADRSLHFWQRCHLGIHGPFFNCKCNKTEVPHNHISQTYLSQSTHLMAHPNFAHLVNPEIRIRRLIPPSFPRELWESLLLISPALLPHFKRLPFLQLCVGWQSWHNVTHPVPSLIWAHHSLSLWYLIRLSRRPPRRCHSRMIFFHADYHFPIKARILQRLPSPPYRMW